MVGLDAGGKTTILYKLKLGEVVTPVPTIEYNVETIEYRNIPFVICECSGAEKVRPLWQNYYAYGKKYIIFVIDSNDRERIDGSDNDNNAKSELDHLLAADELKDAALLVLANKHDLSNTMSVKEVTERLGLDGIRNRQWFIQPTCATTGDGIKEGLDWIIGLHRF